MNLRLIKVRPHYAAQQNATHCSFAMRQKLLGICQQCDRVHMKKEFFANLLQVTKTVERDRRTCSDFFLKPFWNPLFIICRAASFDGTDNLPIEFVGCAASNGMPQPSQRNVRIYLWHGVTFATQPCRTLSLCATRHSVDVPLGFLYITLLGNKRVISPFLGFFSFFLFFKWESEKGWPFSKRKNYIPDWYQKFEKLL